MIDPRFLFMLVYTATALAFGVVAYFGWVRPARRERERERTESAPREGAGS